MANKVRFYHTWDLKNIYGVITVIGGLAIFLIAYYNYPAVLDFIKLSQYDKETTGQIIKVDEEVIFRQTNVGSKPTIDHFNVEYTYELDGQTFNSKAFVNGTNSNAKELDRIMKTSNKSVLVKFLSKDPAKSTIDLRSN